MDRRTANRKKTGKAGTASAGPRFRVINGNAGKRRKAGRLESLEPKKSKRGLIAVLVIAVILLLAAAAVFFILRYYHVENVYVEGNVLGTVNGANFTDGLDGLAASVTVMIATFLAAAAIGTGSRIEPVACAVAGALLGFLLFNVYPASVFMGDTGSLALGGFVAASAYMMRMQLFIPIIGFVYLIEVLSVILQVFYFKITGGKRLFRMAPLHHHFELCGWSETRIVAAFSILTALLCLVALIAM